MFPPAGKIVPRTGRQWPGGTNFPPGGGADSGNNVERGASRASRVTNFPPSGNNIERDATKATHSTLLPDTPMLDGTSILLG